VQPDLCGGAAQRVDEDERGSLQPGDADLAVAHDTLENIVDSVE
jgi:hypothetical protein